MRSIKTKKIEARKIEATKIDTVARARRGNDDASVHHLMAAMTAFMAATSAEAAAQTRQAA